MKNPATQTRRGPVFFLAIAVGAVLVVIFSMKYARHLGNEDAEQAIARLSLVWPSFRSMPVEDRALLAGLSMTCHMPDRPVVKSAVVACLQEAAADPKAKLPKGFDRSRAQTRLEALLREAA